MNRIVFTNGCFDLLHPGHIDFLIRAKALGTRLVVGLNSDDSVRSIKGSGRPFQTQDERKAILSALNSVDEVIIFDELTPEKLIQKIKPHVLVKGGDWPTKEIIGSDFVAANGGEVVSLPLLDGFSSSSLVERIQGERILQTNGRSGIVSESLDELQATFSDVSKTLIPLIEKCAKIIVETFHTGNKVLICGNGGSAADAQHLSAEFVGRFEKERRSLPAIAITTDTSALTAIANDYDFENVFARQIESLANQGDCLIAISTSGNSPNIISAVMEARRRGCRIIGMTGTKGKKLASLSDASIIVPSQRTARIQEVHIVIAHIWCEMVDAEFTDLGG